MDQAIPFETIDQFAGESLRSPSRLAVQSVKTQTGITVRFTTLTLQMFKVKVVQVQVEKAQLLQVQVVVALVCGVH